MAGGENLDARGHELLVRLAAWMHTLTQQGRTTFTREDMGRIAGLEELAGDDHAAARARGRALSRLNDFGLDVAWNDDGQRYLIRHLDLTEREQRALAQAALVAAYQDWELMEAWNVPAAFVATTDVPIRLVASPMVEPLAEAISAQQCVSIRHRGVERVVQPLALAVRSGRWYLAAFDPAAGIHKLFGLGAIDRVTEAEAAWDPTAADIDVDPLVDELLDPQTWAGEPEVEVTVLVDPRLEALALRALPRATHTGTASDGRIEVTCRVGNVDHFLYRLMELRSGAEVTEPPEVRSRVVEHLQRMVG